MSRAVKWIGSPNFRNQTGVKKRFVVMHWMVGYLSSTDAVFQRASYRVSTQYGIEDGTIHQYVADEDYAFGSGTTYANQYGISIEHSAGNLVRGVRRPSSAATNETSAQLLAMLSKRHGWGKLVVGKNVFRHNNFVRTECSGTLPVDAIVARANQILGAGGSTVSAPSKPSGAYKEATSVADYQRLLNDHGYGLVVDGDKGPATTQAIKAFQKKKGLGVDGLVGPQTLAALRTTKPAAKPTGIAVDGKWGSITTRGLQRLLGVTQDGIYGPDTKRALQKRLGVTADGIVGPATKRALQKRLGVTADGIVGPDTVRALQRAINAGRI